MPEEGNHFLDTEDLDGKPLPATNRFDAIKLIANELKKEPNKVGMLPYAIMEYYEKLTIGFYDYRKSPTNSAIPMKCLVYGGILAHYTGDAAMPLHATREFDGKRRADGTVMQKGIHPASTASPRKTASCPKKSVVDWRRRRSTMFGSTSRSPSPSRTHRFRSATNSTRVVRSPNRPRRAGPSSFPASAGAQLTLDLWYNAWLKSEKLPPHW